MKDDSDAGGNSIADYLRRTGQTHACIADCTCIATKSRKRDMWTGIVNMYWIVHHIFGIKTRDAGFNSGPVVVVTCISRVVALSQRDIINSTTTPPDDISLPIILYNNTAFHDQRLSNLCVATIILRF